MTVQEVYDLFSRHKKDVSNVSDQLFWDWCDEVNRFAYRIIYANSPETVATTASISVTSGTATYNLPADFLNILPLGTGFFYVYDGVVSNDMYVPTEYGSQDEGYYLNNGTVTFTPSPTQSKTVSLRYIPEIATIDAYEDTLVVPDEFIYYVRDAIDQKYSVWDEDLNSEGLADARFVRALDELARNLKKDVSTVGIETYNNAYYG